MADAAPGPDSPPQKKSKLVLLIILTVAVLVLAGGGYFAYTKFFAAPPAAPAAEGEGGHGAKEEKKVEKKAEKKEEKKGGHGGGEKKKEGAKEAEPSNMFELEPFIVNLSDPKGKRYLKVKITLELDLPETAEKAKLAIPKMRDMVIMMLTSLTFEEVMTPEGKIRVHDELLERFNQIIKPERITNIYFTDFVVQ